MGQNTCIVGLGSFCAWLAFTLSGIALFAPFWMTTSILGLKYSKGIVMVCTDPFGDNRDCEWTAKDTWEDATQGEGENLGENWLTVQVLWILGCAFFLLNAILSFLLCCDSCKNTCCSITLTALVFLAAACLTVSVIIFGSNNGDKWDRELTLASGQYYDWGYYVAIVAAISSVVAIICMSLNICFNRNN